MSEQMMLVVGAGLVGFLVGVATMLLMRERSVAGRVWDTDASRLFAPPEDLSRTDRQHQDEDTQAQGKLSASYSTATGGTHPLHVTTRGGAPVAMLTAETGPYKGRSWLLRYAASTTIGRFDDCDIAINDNGVSRLHAQIMHRTDAATAHEFAVFDYSSTNGTVVNGQPINAVASLQDGDQILIGNTQFRFRRVRHD